MSAPNEGPRFASRFAKDSRFSARVRRPEFIKDIDAYIVTKSFMWKGKTLAVGMPFSIKEAGCPLHQAKRLIEQRKLKPAEVDVKKLATTKPVVTTKPVTAKPNATK